MEDIKEEKKMSYEQLEDLYNKTVIAAKKIEAENDTLRRMNDNLAMRLNYSEVGFAFKALEFRELFSPEFIKKVVAKLEEILEPQEEEKEEKYSWLVMTRTIMSFVSKHLSVEDFSEYGWSF